MNKLLHTISKHCFWTEDYEKRKAAKGKINTLKSLTFEVIIKQWEHQSWGNCINIKVNGRVYGHISGLRHHQGFFTMPYCDLEDGDILIYEIAEKQRYLVNGDKYVVGCLVNVEKAGDPQDMFFADFEGLFTTKYTSDIKEQAENEIKRLKQYI